MRQRSPADWDRIAVADGVEIAYTESGSGAPVVFVTGWTMSGEVFEHQLAGLAERYRAITFDPRSHGRSTVTLAGNSYPQQGRDLRALLDALELTGVHLVGWSYGALACHAVIEQEGLERVRSLTVLDQSPKPLSTGAKGDGRSRTWTGSSTSSWHPWWPTPRRSAPSSSPGRWIVSQALVS